MTFVFCWSFPALFWAVGLTLRIRTAPGMFNKRSSIQSPPDMGKTQIDRLGTGNNPKWYDQSSEIEGHLSPEFPRFFSAGN